MRPVEMMPTSLPPRRLAALPMRKMYAGIEHDGDGAAQQAHVDRAIVIGDGLRRGHDLGGVARIDDGEAGDHAHQRHILDGLMGAAIAGG
jgi:hypothetical protein